MIFLGSMFNLQYLCTLLIRFRMMENKQKDIIIANPIYDVVFKELMTTNKGEIKNIAGFFVSTILDENITDIDLLPQEYTYFTKSKKKTEDSQPETLAIIRLDFVATIRTEAGENKKVLIEIQKSNKSTDISRFRTYLGEQYKLVDKEENKEPKSMPIVVIYMLGFELPDIEEIVVKVNRTYMDVIGGGEIKRKSPFIESLTHDGYFIQISRINREMYSQWEQCSEIEQLLSLFEQDYFVEENFYKKYPYPITNQNIKNMVETLEYIAADPKTRRIMQEEYWATWNETIWENKVTVLTNKIAERENTIVERENTIATLANQNDALANQNDALASQNAELKRLLQQSGISFPFS